MARVLGSDWLGLVAASLKVLSVTGQKPFGERPAKQLRVGPGSGVGLGEEGEEGRARGRSGESSRSSCGGWGQWGLVAARPWTTPQVADDVGQVGGRQQKVGGLKALPQGLRAGRVLSWEGCQQSGPFRGELGGGRGAGPGPQDAEVNRACWEL